MQIRPWAERTFVQARALADVTVLISRVNGTPARLEDAIRGIEERVVRVRPPARATAENLRAPLRWSPLDHAGHLLDIDELHSQRIKDFLNGVESLTPADPKNSKTEAEHYNRQLIDPILQCFRVGRSTLTNILFALPDSAFEKRAKHPRTGDAIRLLDYVELIAEHDDHHLATIRELIWNPTFS